jgi:hypothetical protein
MGGLGSLVNRGSRVYLLRSYNENNLSAVTFAGHFGGIPDIETVRHGFVFLDYLKLGNSTLTLLG